MTNNNPEVFPHPASQIKGITLFDIIVLSIIHNNIDACKRFDQIMKTDTHTASLYDMFDIAKEILNLRNIAIENLDNYKSMSQIMKEIEDNE